MLDKIELSVYPYVKGTLNSHGVTCLLNDQFDEM